MVVKVKEYFEKTRQLKTTTNLKNTFYEDKEILDIMKEFYQIKRNLIISSIFSKSIIDTELYISAYTNISTSYAMIYHTLM